MNVSTKFTYNDYLLMPDEKRYELLDGEFYMVPSPNEAHQRVSGNLEFLLRQHVRESGLGFVYDAPFDVVLSDEDVVQPDILYISKERSNIITENNVSGSPDLVVEVISSSSSKRDQEIKSKIYSKYGVKEYWIVNPIIGNIEVRSLKGGLFETIRTYDKDEVLTSQVLRDLKIDLKEVF
ncbi:MAG: Uma2 family endonuclease [Candidatus Scalindua sp.]